MISLYKNFHTINSKKELCPQEELSSTNPSFVKQSFLKSSSLTTDQEQILKNIAEIKKHIERLFLLNNRPVKDDVLTAIAEQFEDEGYKACAILEACLSLYDQDLQNISFAVIKSKVKHFAKVNVSQNNDPECKYCKNLGTLGAKFNNKIKDYQGNDSYANTLIACVCAKGQRLGAKFGWHVWDGISTQLENKKFGTLYIDKLD